MVENRFDICSCGHNIGQHFFFNSGLSECLVGGCKCKRYDGHSKDFEQGRVEGAKQELECLHKLINNDLNYGHLLIRKQINDLIKKRLKELKKGGKE